MSPLFRRNRHHAAGLEPGRVPPGQYVTTRLPVVTYGATPEIDLETWDLRIEGAVERPARLAWPDISELPQVDLTCDVHSEHGWSRLGTSWAGVRVSDALERAGVLPAATHALVRGEGGYSASVPLAALLEDDAILAHTLEGAPLDPEHGHPLRLLLPGRYLRKSVKWIRRIELTTEHRPGFWEVQGRSLEGDPWASQVSPRKL